MNSEMGRRVIPFSPPDISEAEMHEVVKTLESGWITTGPRTKLLERRLAAFIDTGRTDIDCDTEESVQEYSNRVVCLNSATASEELNLRILGIKEGDEVIVPAYTYTSTASAAIHCGARENIIDENTSWKRMLLTAEQSMFGAGVVSYRQGTQEKKYVKSLFHAAYREDVINKVL